MELKKRKMEHSGRCKRKAKSEKRRRLDSRWLYFGWWSMECCFFQSYAVWQQISLLCELLFWFHFMVRRMYDKQQSIEKHFVDLWGLCFKIWLGITWRCLLLKFFEFPKYFRVLFLWQMNEHTRNQFIRFSQQRDNMLTKLPDILIFEVITKWLTVKNIGFLDSAVCSTFRNLFLSIFKSPHFRINQNLT